MIVTQNCNKNTCFTTSRRRQNEIYFNERFKVYLAINIRQETTMNKIALKDFGVKRWINQKHCIMSFNKKSTVVTPH